MAKLTARFVMENGVPAETESDGAPTYKIILSIAEPPVDALTIIYQLSGNYSNPIRMVTKGVPDFEEIISADRDVEIVVAYRSIGNPSQLSSLLSRRLSEALSETYAGTSERSVTEAVRLIRAV